MRKSLSSVLLGLSLLSPACKSKREPPAVDLASAETVAARDTADDPPPPEDNAESSGAGTAMHLDEGKLGKADNVATRTQATETARRAGVLGSADIAAGFDTSGTYGAGRLNALAGRADISSSGGEAYHDWGKNRWTDAAKDHLSTFAADVDR